MKKSTKHMLNIILGGVFFLIPVLIAIMLISKAFRILNPISRAIADVLDHSNFLKVFLVELISVLILIGICYLAGLLLKKGIIKNWKGNMEEKLFFLFPGLQRLKMSLLGDEKGYWGEKWQAAIFREDQHFRVGFISKGQNPHYYCVYLPDAPRMDAGEVRYYPASTFEYQEISLKELTDSLRTFGSALPEHSFPNPPENNTKERPQHSQTRK